MNEISDEVWRELAEGSRRALAELGYAIGPMCLPGEPEACGGTCLEHVTANLAALQAVIDHHWLHARRGPDSADMYAATFHTITCDLLVACGRH